MWETEICLKLKKRQLEERLLLNEAVLMRWSPNMDLLAIANVKGIVTEKITQKIILDCFKIHINFR
jgi:hypothetical protein